MGVRQWQYHFILRTVDYARGSAGLTEPDRINRKKPDFAVKATVYEWLMSAPISARSLRSQGSMDRGRSSSRDAH